MIGDWATSKAKSNLAPIRPTHVVRAGVWQTAGQRGYFGSAVLFTARHTGCHLWNWKTVGKIRTCRYKAAGILVPGLPATGAGRLARYGYFVTGKIFC